MTSQSDFRKEWPRVKKQLVQFSQEALKLAKKGEKEIIRFSEKGKIQFNMTALSLKREHLFLQIGKEYVKSKCPGPHTSKLNHLIQEFNNLEKEIKGLKKRITIQQVASP